MKINRKINSNDLLYTFLILFFVFSVAPVIIRMITGQSIFIEGVNFFFSGIYSPDTFMDFFNPLLMSTADNPYDYVELGAIYPPICYMIYDWLMSFIVIDRATIFTGGDIRANQYALIICGITTILCLLVLVYYLTKRLNCSKLIKFFVAMSIMFSYPIIYLVERNNILLFALSLIAVFFEYVDSPKAIMREIAIICLAIAAAVKIYPAIFGALLIFRDKDLKNKLNIGLIIRCTVYGVAFFVLPFFYYDGLNTVSAFIENMKHGIEVTGPSYLSVYMRIDLSSVIFTFTNSLLGLNLTVDNILLISKYISFTLSIMFLLGIAIFKENWKKILCCALICICLPSFAYCYASSIMIFPFFALIWDKRNITYSKIIYFMMIAGILIPIFGINSSFCQNVIICIIYISVVADIIVCITKRVFVLKDRKVKA